MRVRVFAIAVIAMIVAITIVARAQEADPPDFLTLETAWAEALAGQNVEELEALLLQEFAIVGANSTIDDALGTRGSWLANAVKYPWPQHEVRVLRVSRDGDTAVVHAVWTADYPPRSITAEGGRLSFLISDTWVLRENSWRVLARHSSLPVQPEQELDDP